MSEPPASLINKITQGDCLEVMARLPDKSIKGIITSPPYNLKNSTGGGFPSGVGKWPKAGLIGAYKGHGDNMPHKDYVAWQRKCLKEMMRVLRPDGAIFYNHKWRVQNGLIQDRADIVSGFPVRQIIIWQKPGGVNFNDGYYLPTYEVIYLIVKPDFKIANKANTLGDVWSIPTARNNSHPAPFPLALATNCAIGLGGGPILDPFMGSGTTALAAKTLGFDWIGIDAAAEYCEQARRRIAKTPTNLFTPQTKAGESK